MPRPPLPSGTPMIYVDAVTGVPCPTSAQWPACSDERLAHEHRLVPGDTPPELHPDTARVLLDVEARREEQVAKGYTRAHDDHEGPGHPTWHAARRLDALSMVPIRDGRDRLIDVIAMLVAAVEVLDRAEARS